MSLLSPPSLNGQTIFLNASSGRNPDIWVDGTVAMEIIIQPYRTGTDTIRWFWINNPCWDNRTTLTFLPVSLNSNIPADFKATFDSQWQLPYRAYGSTSRAIGNLYRPYGSTCLPVSLNGNLPVDLKATFESQWQHLYRAYGSTFLPVSLNGNHSTDLTGPPSLPVSLNANLSTGLTAPPS